MKEEKRRSESDYGHDYQEWGRKDDSERQEWEEHYKSRVRISVKEEEKKDELDQDKTQIDL